MKPGDFLLGVLDFFAILLPGSMATWLVLQYIPRPVLRDALMFGVEGQPTPDTWVLGAALLFSAYTLGHFVFMLGSHLDAGYDRWRERTKPKYRDTTFEAAKNLHDALYADLTGGDLTTLKWARVFIQVKAQNARVEIDRLEADQKFFRSLIVLSPTFAAHFLLGKGAPLAGLAAIAMGVLAYHRYLDQRWKMSELIYATAVVAHRTSAEKGTEPLGGADV
jgi:hypothetical protein